MLIRPEPRGAGVVGHQPHSTATDGIGTPGLTPIRSFPTMESLSIRLAGVSTHRGMRMGLRIMATDTAMVATVTVVSGTLVTSVRDTNRDTPLVVAPPGRLGTRVTFEEAASADSAVVAVSAAAVSPWRRFPWRRRVCQSQFVSPDGVHPSEALNRVKMIAFYYQ